MGMVEVQMEIANPRQPERRAKVTLLADTGANYSMIPRRVLEQIGVAPMEREEFEIADGSRIQRDIEVDPFTKKLRPSKLVLYRCAS